MRMINRFAAVAVATLISITAVAAAQQGKPATGPQEQPGPLGFPGIKHLSEVLKLTAEQSAAVHHIYSEFQKKEHQAQQDAAKEAAKDKSAGSKTPPRVDTKSLRDDMVNEIKTVLTEDQRKSFDEMLSEMGKKKKKAN